MPLFIVFGVIMVAAMALLALGWIAPLIVGLVLRNRGTGHPRAWLIAAGIWGGLALLLGLGAMIAAMSANGVLGGGNASYTPPAETAPIAGPKATLQFDGMKSASLTAIRENGSRATFGCTNGIMLVPAGKLKIERLAMVAMDKRGRPWTANATWPGSKSIELKEGEQRTAPWLPPFAAGIKITSSPVSETFEAEPAYATSDGGDISIAAPSRAKEDTASFEALDAAGKSILRGSFEYG